MRYAVFAATKNGCCQAELVQEALERLGAGCKPSSTEVFVHHKAWRKALSEKAGWQPYHRLAEIVPQVFQRCDAMIFIMAAGIAVRTVAPHLASKLSDPAVLVMDEGGRHIISLLSGHIGGANRLTEYLAASLGADPVITTATDVNRLLAPDVLAAELAAVPFPKENLVIFNGGLLEGKSLHYLLDSTLPGTAEYEAVLIKHGIGYVLCEAGSLQERLCKMQADHDRLYVIIAASSKELPTAENMLYLHPRRLIAGVGCRRGTGCELIVQALESACASLDWPAARLSALASTNVKADEQGLLQAAAELSLPVKFFANQELADKIAELALQESAFVKKTIGVGNVCEAAALCCVDSGKIALPKTKFEKVTVALIWEK